MSIFENIKIYPDDKDVKVIPVIELSAEEAFDYFMHGEQYCTTELPRYFNFDEILKFSKDSIQQKDLDECIEDGENPEKIAGVNFEVISNKDGRYGVRPLTLANPFLYYMMVRDICEETNWEKIQECFKHFESQNIEATALPLKKEENTKEAFKNSTAILNWWNKFEQQSIEFSLKYRYMFVTDISNCFGQINPESISWALSRKDTPFSTEKNNDLANKIKRYLRVMQHGRNMGIPQGSKLFGFIAEIILGYSDMLLAQKIEEAKNKDPKENDSLPKDLEYNVLRHVDDYRIFCNDRDALEKISYMLQEILESFNFRMNTSKTKVTTDVLTESIKPDKRFYIFNTPIENKQAYRDQKDFEKTPFYDFDSFQKHLLFIYEFGRKFPNSGSIITLLDAFNKRLTDFLGLDTKLISIDKKTEENNSIKEELTKEKEKNKGEDKWIPGGNKSVLVSIAIQIAAENVRATHLALKTTSLILESMKAEENGQRKKLIGLIYEKLRPQPNSSITQIWLQHITNETDDWSPAKNEPYDMPLCKLVAGKEIEIWDNLWLKPEFREGFPLQSIVDRKIQKKNGSVIDFDLRYDEVRSHY